MSRIPWSKWGWVPLATLLCGCGKTNHDDAQSSAGDGSGGAPQATLVTGSSASVGGQGSASGSVSTNSTSSVTGTSGASTQGNGGSLGSTTGRGGEPSTSGSAGAGGAAGDSSAWHEPWHLETDDADNAWGPSIDMNDDGAAVVAWAESHSDVDEIWGSLYTPDAGWPGAELVWNLYPGFPVNAPHVALTDAGVARVIWHSTSGPPNLWSNTYDLGFGWGSGAYLNLERVWSAAAPDLALDANGSEVVIWTEHNDAGDSHELWSKRSPEGFETAVPVQTAASVEEPRIAMAPAGNAVTVWVQSDAEARTIWSSHADFELEWSTPERIQSTSTDTSQTPDVAIDARGNAMAVWHQSSASGNHVWANRFEAGVGWAEAELVDTAPMDANHAKLGMDADGNAVAVWRQTDGVVDEIWSNHHDLDLGWGEAVRISAPAASCDFPEIAVNAAGDAVVVWTQSDEADSSLVWSNRYTAGIGWGEPELVDGATRGISEAPDVGIDDAGIAIAVWRHTEDGKSRIWTTHSGRPE